jgi:methyl-accepting chemotaxis protein
MNTIYKTPVEKDREIEKRLAFIGLDEESVEKLHLCRGIVTSTLPEALKNFYQLVATTPEVSRYFADSNQMDTAREAQISHWSAILDGDFDTQYMNRVQRIGSIHARLGLRPRWYIGGYARIIEKLVHAVLEEKWPRRSGLLGKPTSAEETAEMLGSLIKAVLLDMDLSISVYIDEDDNVKRRAQEDAINKERALVVKVFGKAMEEIADNNLAHRIKEEVPDAYVSLVDNFNSSFETLAATVESIRNAAGAINTGSDEIQAAADDLSRRAEQQAAAVEETAAAVEQISSAVRDAAKRAELTGNLVGSTMSDAENSGEIVQTTVEAMGRIAKSSEDISRIIGVIDEIAFQTNLLALNAGVEAARAGEAGRGFAVVAQEVRELAQRSAKAAKEIKQLITTSAKEVQSGVSQVNATGVALEKIVASVRDISINMSSIVETSREQSEALQEINTAVSSVDNGTQQNAALSEELTASSHSLAVEVNQINRMLSQFTVDTFAPPATGSAREQRDPTLSGARRLQSRAAEAFAGNAALAIDSWDDF